MSGKKIVVGYGDGGRPKNKNGWYGSKATGKLKMNGGFNFQPTISFETTPEQRFIDIFGVNNLPKWKKELIDKGIPLE